MWVTAERIRLGIVADPHVSVERDEPAAWHNPYRLADSAERLEAALRHPLVAGADLVALLGDLSHFGDAASIDRVASLGTDAVLLAGNHDVLVDGVRPDPAKPLDGPLAGLGVQIQDVTALSTTRTAQPFDVDGRRLAPGSAGELVLTHFPILSLEREAREAKLLYSGHLDQLAPPPPLDPAPPGRPMIVLSGHQHLRGVTTSDDVLQIVFAALVEPPYEVAAVDLVVDPDGPVTCTYECASVRESEDGVRLPVLAPPAATWSWSPNGGWCATASS